MSNPPPPIRQGALANVDPRWVIGGIAALAVIGWWVWTRSSKQSAQNAANAPITLEDAGLGGNANVSPVPVQDQWPYNQLNSMSQLSLPGVQYVDLTPALQAQMNMGQ